MRKWTFNPFKDFMNTVYIGCTLCLGVFCIFLPIILLIILFYKWKHISEIILAENLEISYLKNGKNHLFKLMKENYQNMHIKFDMLERFYFRRVEGYNLKTTITINDVDGNCYVINDNTRIYSLLINCHIIEGLLELRKELPNCTYEIICNDDKDKQELEFYAENLKHTESFYSARRTGNIIGILILTTILTILAITAIKIFPPVINAIKCFL